MDLGWKTITGGVALAVGLGLLLFGWMEAGAALIVTGSAMIPIGLRDAIRKAAAHIANALQPRGK